MRQTAWLLMGLILVASPFLAAGCGGGGEKPEYVEVPAGEPSPPYGDGEPLQDATGDQGCGEDEAAQSLWLTPWAEPVEAPPALRPEMHREVMPPEWRQPVRKAPLEGAMWLGVPLGLCLLLRRR